MLLFGKSGGGSFRLISHWIAMRARAYRARFVWPLPCCGKLLPGFCGEIVAMPIAQLTLEIRIEGAQSLKDKRQVLRSLKDKLRAGFNVSVAEVEQTDLWQRATVAVVSVSGSRDYLDGLMQTVEKSAFKIVNNAGGEVVDSFVEFT